MISRAHSSIVYVAACGYPAGNEAQRRSVGAEERLADPGCPPQQRLRVPWAGGDDQPRLWANGPREAERAGVERTFESKSVDKIVPSPQTPPSPAARPRETKCPVSLSVWAAS